MRQDLEEIEASYLQDPSFLGQQVVVPGAAWQAPVSGVLSDVAVYRPGTHLHLLACPGSPGHPSPVVVVGVPRIEVFLGGQRVALRPSDLVLAEPAPSQADRP